MLLCLPAIASAATFHVSPEGSDLATGSATQPFASIGRAALTARSGDTVEVASGTYRETVTVPANSEGISFHGVGPTRPVIDGERTRQFGFVARSTNGTTIQNFDIRNQTEAGVYLFRSNAATIADNVMDHIGSYGSENANGVKVSYGADMRVTGNTISSIGPGAQAIGIWLLQTTRALVDDNTVYLVRKEGIRDWQGLDNRISNNRTFLTWSGLSLNTSTGSEVVNNYSYDNVNGIVVKHTSYAPVLRYWGLSEAHMAKVWNNTVWRSTGVALALGQSGEPFDYVDVRNNLFDDAGLAYIQDMPNLRGEHVTVDGNAYAPLRGGRPTYFYKATWRENTGGIANFNTYREKLGWDRNGRVVTPSFVDPASGNFNVSASSLAADSADAPPESDSHQLGAQNLAPASTTWQPYPMTAIDSSSKGTWWTRKHLKDTSDDDQFSYWLSETNRDEFVTFDLGQQRSFDLLVLTVFSDLDNRNIRGYRFEVSRDGDSWQTVLEGENPDAAGSSYKYELPEAVTGRYLRFTMKDTFCESDILSNACGEYFVLSDLRVGKMNAGAPTPPVIVTTPDLGLQVKVPRQSLTKVLRKRAFAASATCTDACRVTSRLNGRRGVAIAQAVVDGAAGEPTGMRLRLTKAGRKRLERGTAGKLRLRTTAVGRDGATARATSKINLAH